MTKTPETRLWALEFGYGYDVPKAIDAAVEKGELTDNSWHNDVMPHFIRRDGLNLWALWVDHPRPEEREFPENAFRFSVYHSITRYAQTSEGDESCRYQGNDLDAALSAILNTNGTEPVKNAPKSPEPDSTEWMEHSFKSLQHLVAYLAGLIKKYDGELAAWGEFIGGGSVVRIERNDEAQFDWGTANPHWGADVRFPWNEDGDIDDSISLDISSEHTDLDYVAAQIILATKAYQLPPEPQTPKWFDRIALKVAALGGDRFSKVETYHSGGGIWGVAVTRASDGAWLFWGTQTETWGADAHTSYEADHSRALETRLTTDTKDLDTVAAVIVAHTLQCDLSTEQADAKRLDDAVDTAEQAFWASIADSYPECKTGDLDPLVIHRLIEEMRAAVKLWIRYNATDTTKEG